MLRTFCSLKSMYWEVWWSAGSNPNIWNVRMNSIWIGFEGGGQLSNICCIFFLKYCRGVGGWGAGHCQWQTPNNKNAIFPTTCALYFAKYSEFWIEHHVEEEHASREKKLSVVNFLIFVQKNVSRIRFQEIKIRLGICRDRRDRRSCKIFVSCVNFPRKQRSFLHIFQV